MVAASSPIEVETDRLEGAVMKCSGKSVLLFVSLCVVLINTNLLTAQTGLDDVHITPRLSAATLATKAPGIELLASSGYDHGIKPTIRTSVDLVTVPVTITDSLHRPVVGLDQNNFQLFENKKPRAIKHFSSEDTPISLGIIVDSSGSMADKIDRTRDAVREFCEIANPQDEFFMIAFSETPRLAVDFTPDSDKIQNEMLTTGSKGRTSLLDAIYMGLQKMRTARYGRKALLIISDGGDNHSRYTEKEIRAAVKESDVLIYAVGVYDQYVNTQEEMLGPDLLRNVSSLTGGQAYALTNPLQLPAAAKNIGSQLRHQYVLAYQPDPAPHDGKWHKITVKLRLPRQLPFLHVEARTGYYAAAE